MLGHDLPGTERAKEENPCLLIEAQEVVEPFERLLVTPLQIIEEQQQGLRRKQNRSRQCLEEALALPAFKEVE
jgi:hypothetical protein